MSSGRVWIQSSFWELVCYDSCRALNVKCDIKESIGCLLVKATESELARKDIKRNAGVGVGDERKSVALGICTPSINSDSYDNKIKIKDPFPDQVLLECLPYDKMRGTLGQRGQNNKISSF